MFSSDFCFDEHGSLVISRSASVRPKHLFDPVTLAVITTTCLVCVRSAEQSGPILDRGKPSKKTRSKTDYKPIVITPVQTLAILKALSSPLHFTLVLTCAATALRASEMLALRWADVLWNEGRIRISKRWANGKDGETKTEASDGYVPLHPILSAHLRSWREQSPYAEDGDFVSPSLKARGRVPLSASIFVADYLRPATKKAGAHIEDGQRFGLHNLRHSLSNWQVNKTKVEPKTVQGILRHARVQTTLDLYTQGDSDETLAAQGEYLTALGVGSYMVQ